MAIGFRANPNNSPDWWEINLLLCGGKYVIASYEGDKQNLRLNAAFSDEMDARAYLYGQGWDAQLILLTPGGTTRKSTFSGYWVKSDLPEESWPIAFLEEAMTYLPLNPPVNGIAQLPSGEIAATAIRVPNWTPIERVLNVEDDVWLCQFLVEGRRWYGWILKDALEENSLS